MNTSRENTRKSCLANIRENKSKNSSLGILALFVIYSFFSFFSICIILRGLFGIKQQDGYLEIYSVTIAILSGIVYIHSILKRRCILIKEIIVLSVCVLIVCAFIVSYTVYGFNEGAYDTLLEFIVRAIPAMLMAITIAKERALYSIIKKVDYFIIFNSISLAIVLFNGMYKGYNRRIFLEMFGYDYQGISYIAALTFGLTIYMIFYASKKYEFKPHMQPIRVVLLFIQISTCIYSGGRGGFVLLVTYALFIIYYDLLIKRKISRSIQKVLVITLCSIIVGSIMRNNLLIIEGFNRITEYINPSGRINWAGTSGRDLIYRQTINLIAKKPIFGYGIAGATYNGRLSTHNLFLEVMVEGGVVYLLFCIFILSKFAKRIITKMNMNTDYCLISIIFIGDFVSLMFSFIYLRTSAIWFCIVYMFIESINIKKSQFKRESQE